MVRGGVLPNGCHDENGGLAMNEDKTVKFNVNDPVNHPPHYTRFPGVEVIQITEHLNFCRGSAVKYLCRAGHKGDELEDLLKALWYVKREIRRVEKDL